MSMILWIIAIRLALLLLLVAVCLLSIRTGVDAVGIDGEVSVEARYGSLRIPIWPPPAPEPKEPQQSAAEEQPKKNEKKRKYHYVLNREALDIGEIADLALTMLSELADELRISRLRVRVRIATADAARTGMLLGGASALTGMLVPFWRILVKCGTTTWMWMRISRKNRPIGHLRYPVRCARCGCFGCCCGMAGSCTVCIND